jgi:hypothetical protein
MWSTTSLVRLPHHQNLPQNGVGDQKFEKYEIGDQKVGF